MRALRYVKHAAEGHFLVLETCDGAEEFLLEIDVALRDAVRSDLPRFGGGVEPEQQISPREIQVRVRAGESPQELAESHHARLELIMRFAAPVQAERARVVDEARRARARRSTTEGQTVVFGEAVDARFTAYGLDPAAVRWDARRREDGQWVVSAHWVAGDAERTAEWTFHLASRSVTPIDDTAADLLSDLPIQPLTPPVEKPRRNRSSAPRLARGVVAFPVLSEPADEQTGPPPMVEDELFDQDAFAADRSGHGASAHTASAHTASDLNAANRGGATSLGATSLGATSLGATALGTTAPTHDAAAQAALESDTADLADRIDVDAPLLPLHLTTGAPRRPTNRKPRGTNLGVAARDAELGTDKAGRPTVPSWDDILLGVRRKSD